MQLINLVVLRNNRHQVGQLLDPAQVLQLVIGYNQRLQHRELRDIRWQLSHAQVREVNRLLVAALGMPDFELDVREHI